MATVEVPCSRLKIRRRLILGLDRASRKLDWLRRMAGQKILYCLGDSHVKVFQYLDKERWFRRTTLRVTVVGGATALGLVNPNSVTDALNRFCQELERISPRDHLLFLLGEVDCGFVIWYRARKHGLPVETQFEASVSNYQSFLAKVLEQGYRNVIVCSVPLPTIRDGQTWGEVADARKEVTASLAERTKLTLQYNARLRQFCEEMGVSFLDFEDEILDRDAEVVKHEFLNPDPLDHHLNPVAMAPVWAKHLGHLGYD